MSDPIEMASEATAGDTRQRSLEIALSKQCGKRKADF